MCGQNNKNHFQRNVRHVRGKTKKKHKTTSSENEKQQQFDT